MCLRLRRISVIDDPSQTLQLFVFPDNFLVKSRNLLLHICQFLNVRFSDLEHVSSKFVILLVAGFESLSELGCRSSVDVKVCLRNIRKRRRQHCRGFNCRSG